MILMNNDSIVRLIQEAADRGRSYLDLSNRCIESLPPQLWQLKQLTELNLHRNQIQEIPAAIGQLTNLKKLRLSGNKIRVIPQALSQLANLEVLELGNNQIQEIPVWVLSQIAGKSLLLNTDRSRLSVYLGHNQIREIPQSVGQLWYLRLLDLSHNQIRVIPEAIGQLVNLDTLSLNVNPIDEISEAIGELSNLRNLTLSYNQMAAIPKSIGKLCHILYLVWDEEQPKQNIWSLAAKYDRSASFHDMSESGESLPATPAAIACDILTIKTTYLADIVTIELDSDRTYVETITIYSNYLNYLRGTGGYDFQDWYELFQFAQLKHLKFFLDSQWITSVVVPEGTWSELQTVYVDVRCREDFCLYIGDELEKLNAQLPHVRMKAEIEGLGYF
jgi:Leucine rich repeat